MSLYDKLHGGSQGSAVEPRRLSAKDFLGQEGRPGYTTNEQLLAYVRSLRKDEVEDLELLFKLLNMQHRIDNQTKTRVDKAGRTYVYPRFIISKKSAPGCKVILEAGMQKLIEDYASALIEVNFSLDELVEEA